MSANYTSLIEAIAQEPTYNFTLQDSQVATHVLQFSRQEQADLAVAIATWCLDRNEQVKNEAYEYGGYPFLNVYSGYPFVSAVSALFQLLKCKLPFNQAQLLTLLTFVNNPDHRWPLVFGMVQLTKTLEQYLQDQPCTPEIQAQIVEIIQLLLQPAYLAEYRHYATRLEKLVQSETEIRLPILVGEAWADVAIQYLEALPREQQHAWSQLLELCESTSTGKPDRNWLKVAQPLLKQVGVEAFQQAVLQWFTLIDKPRTQLIEPWLEGQPDPNLRLNDRNADILRGLVWLCTEQANAALAQALARVAVSAYRKVPVFGARCIRLGNACVWALGQLEGDLGVAPLAWLKVKVKLGTAQKGIEKALTATAKRINLPRAELEELSVPTYGLETVGLRQETLGEFTAELEITGSHSTVLRWFKADGTPQKSVPKAVKDHYAAELKELKQAAKGIQTMLPVQRDRIESLYLQEKTWPFSIWQERYLNHPLVGAIARRLIWQFTEGQHVA
ncbi:MAG: DUF4132 domain-containing protein, partial [Cyanobacteria bacterium P01_H01_bin.121]